MRISSNIGHYNFANQSEKSFCVTIYEDGLNLSEIWDVDDEFDCRIDTVSEFLDLLNRFEKRINSWWISTSKQEKLNKVKILRERAPVLVRDMLIERLKRLKKECQTLEDEIDTIQEEIAIAEPDPEYHSPHEELKELLKKKEE